MMRVPDTSAIHYLQRENGLSSGQIHDLARHPDGRLWFATPSGLASFDGSRVATFSRDDGLRSHGLRAVDISATGDVWVGSDFGFDVVENGKVLNSLHDNEVWRYGFVECLHCHEDSVWLGTASGLVSNRGKGTSVVHHPELGSQLITAVISGRDDSIWAATAASGLFRLAESRWRAIDESDWSDIGPLRCIFPGNENRMLLGGTQGFVEVSTTGRVVARQHTAAAGIQVSALFLYNDELWAGVGKQLQVYRRAADVWHLDRIAIDGHYFNAIVADQFGNIWAATESHGVAKVRALASAIKRVPLDLGQSIFCIRETAQERKIIAAGDTASWIVDLGQTHRPKAISQLAGDQVWDILANPDGSFWAATANGLKQAGADGIVKQIGAESDVLSKPNRCLLRHNGNLYIGTQGGCAIVAADLSVATVPTLDNTPIGYVYTLEKCRRGRVWAGTLGNGLWTLVDSQFHRVEHDLLSLTGNTYAIDVHEDNRLVFVQDDKIYLMHPDGAITLLAQSDESIAGWTVRWAPDGSIWTGSASGLTQYNSEDGHRMKQVNALLGQSNWEFTTSRSLHIADDGIFYCGVNSGLVKFDNKALENLTKVPVVSLDAVSWGQVEPDWKDGIPVLPFGRWTVSIAVSACWFIDEDDLFFRFRLSGFDEHWRPLHQLASIQFNSLPPGEYHLEAQAFNRLVGFGPVASLMKIRVVTPRWANRFFMAPFAGLRVLRRVSAALSRNKSLNDKTIELERVVGERTADLEQAKRRLETLNSELASMSLTDALTGVSNRRHFDELMKDAVADVGKTGIPMSLILLDVDSFKPYNDHYGHARGDDCLSYIARKLVATLYRPADIVARYGGEEFAVILPNVSVGGAMSLAERLRRGIESLDIEHKGSLAGHITVSLGVTTLEKSLAETDPDLLSKLLIETVDSALYEAKEHGRNQCIFKSLP